MDPEEFEVLSSPSIEINACELKKPKHKIVEVKPLNSRSDSAQNLFVKVKSKPPTTLIKQSKTTSSSVPPIVNRLALQNQTRAETVVRDKAELNKELSKATPKKFSAYYQN